MNVGFIYDVDKENVIGSGFEPLEPGDYKVRVTECKFEPTYDGNGQQFRFKYTIQEGNNRGRIIFDDIVLKSSNEKLEAFGKQKLNSFMLAIDHPHFDGDTDEFLGGEFIATINLKDYTKKDGTSGSRNNVVGYTTVSATQNTVVNSAPLKPSAPKSPALGNGVPVNPFARR